MALTVSIELLSGSYDASETDDRERAEWPPHPARVFSALVAAARDDDERAALRWLEQQPPPIIVAAPPAGELRRAGYVVVNALSATGGNQVHPGRTNGLRTRSRTVPGGTTVMITWSGDADPGTVAALDRMARRIPYLGRSTGVALVGAAATDVEVPAAENLDVYEPCDLLSREVSVRVPYRGFLGELDAQFAADRPAWEVSRYQGYRRRTNEVTSTGNEYLPAPSVYTDLVVFRFAGLRPQANLAVRFTSALRSAVLAAAGGAAPDALHGHGADGRPHVAFLALPDVGGEHSDGHLLGLAVAVPDLPDPQRHAALRAIASIPRADVDGVAVLDVPRIGTVELLRAPGFVRPWGAKPERWRRGSRRWASATPVVLDRFPKRADQVEAEIRATMARVGLPEPVELVVSNDPLITGAARLRPADLPQRAKGRLFRHVRVTFERPVAGPVLVGAGRYLGIGLLAPVSDDE